MLTQNYNKQLIRLFIDSADKIFMDLKVSEKSIITGAKNILKQPEFEDPEHFQSIIELIEDKDIIVHIMEENENKDDIDNVKIIIGKESSEKKLIKYSTIKKSYQAGQASGIVGVIGPKRMEYSKAVAAVIYVAEQLSNGLKKI